MHHLGPGLVALAFRRWNSCALSDLHLSDRDRVYPIAINLGLKPYQQERITAFINPDIDRQGSAWAINQSLIAFGSGGGPGKDSRRPNTQIELGFLPATAVHNDYIFSAIGEQWGFRWRNVFARRLRLTLTYRVCSLPFAPVINLDSYWSSVSPLSFLPTFFRTSE
jgi:cell division protein FtsW (lipid II flippase)